MIPGLTEPHRFSFESRKIFWTRENWQQILFLTTARRAKRYRPRCHVMTIHGYKSAVEFFLRTIVHTTVQKRRTCKNVVASKFLYRTCNRLSKRSTHLYCIQYERTNPETPYLTLNIYMF